MRVSIVIFDGFSLLNFTQIYENLSVNHEFDIKICAYKAEIKDKFGLFITPQIHSQSLYGFDAIIVPDGINQTLANDEIYLSWLKSAKEAKYKIIFGKNEALFHAAGFENFIHFDEFCNDEFRQFFSSVL